MKEMRTHRPQTVRGLAPGGALLAIILACLALPRDARADTITPRAGEKLENVEIVQAQWDQVQYRQASNRPVITLTGAQVKSIERDSPLLASIVKLIDAGDYEGATERLKMVPPDQDWVQAAALYLLGDAYATEGDYDKATVAFEAYLKKYESKKDWYVPFATAGLAEALLKDRKPSQAEIHFKKLAGFGGAWELYSKLGQAAAMIESRGAAAAALDARRLYDEVARRSGAPVDLRQKAHLGRARVFLLQKQYEQVIKELDQGIFSSSDAEALTYTAERAEGSLLMGLAYKAQGGQENLHQAEIWLLRVPALYGKHVAVYAAACDALVEVYEALGNQKRADDWKARKAALTNA